MSPPADARSLDIAFLADEPPAYLVQAAKDAYGPDHPDLAPWYFAQCFRCNEADDVDNAQPFRDDTERDSWAVAHVASAGHVVKVFTQGHISEHVLATAPHTAAMLSFDESRQGWRYVCTDKACERSQGPYDSGQLALASLRGHTAKASR